MHDYIKRYWDRKIAYFIFRRIFSGDTLNKDLTSGIRERWIAIENVLLTIVDSGGGQILRFIGNLVLTRLLFPEAFGTMAIVNSVCYGLTVFTQIGLTHNTIYHKEGDKPDFLMTVWTIGIYRGFLLFFLTFLASAPVAKFYNQPILVELLPFVGLSSVFSGASSINAQLLARERRRGPVVVMEVGIYAVVMIVAAIFAYFYRSIWVLASIPVISSLVTCIASHFYFKGYSHRLVLDKRYTKEIFTFGKWIVISLMFVFITKESRLLVAGKVISAADLGVFSVAYRIVGFPSEMLGSFGSNYLFPLYAKFIRDGTYSSQLLRKIQILKLLSCIALGGIYILTAIFGEVIISFLYDPRYADAGGILGILAMSYLPTIVNTIHHPIFVAHGDSFSEMKLMCFKSLILLLLTVLGAVYFGLSGIVWAAIPISLLSYVIYTKSILKYRLWSPLIEIPYLILSVAIIIYCRHLLGYTWMPLLK